MIFYVTKCAKLICLKFSLKQNLKSHEQIDHDGLMNFLWFDPIALSALGG